jgi:muramoyltetrapeptide carboxypeptidase
MKKTILPKRLQQGDHVALITPAFAASEDKIKQSKQRLEATGLKVIDLTKNDQGDGYFAASAAEIVHTLHQAFKEEKIKGIFTVRGGYGCARLLPLLNWNLIAANPKVVIGFSDLTALLIAIHQQTGLVTFHGPSAAITWPDITHHSLQEILFLGNSSQYRFLTDKSENNILKEGKAQGELIGGNLSVLSSLIGSNYLPQDWSNKILFLEDVHEDVYRIDRMLMQLKLANILGQIKGLIFGRFNDCPERTPNSFTLLEVQQRYAQDLAIPVLVNMTFGHQPEMYTFPIGAEVQLDTDNGFLQLLNPAVQ